MIRRLSGAAALAVVLGCAPSARAQDAEPAAQPVGEAGAEAEQLPVGLGSLTQNDLAVRLRTDALEIRFVPLDERVLRLLAPDAYRSLRAIRTAQQPIIDSIARDAGVSTPAVVLVSFYGQQQGSRFEPDLLTINARNRNLLPIGFIPLSPTFSSQQLDLRQSASGLFLYEDELPVTEPFVVLYGTLRSNDWERKLNLLDRERARIGSRVTPEARAQ